MIDIFDLVTTSFVYRTSTILAQKNTCINKGTIKDSLPSLWQLYNFKLWHTVTYRCSFSHITQDFYVRICHSCKETTFSFLTGQLALLDNSLLVHRYPECSKCFKTPLASNLVFAQKVQHAFVPSNNSV